MSFLALAACLASCLAGGTQDPFSCGPFLLRPGTHSITVVVDHKTKVSAELRYGVVDRAETKRLEHDTARRHHVFVLDGLLPGTRYWYEISSGKKLGSGRHHFRTLPIEPSTYQLIVLGDVRTLRAPWRAVSERVFREEKDALFIIGTGDYPSDGRNYELWIREFFEPGRTLLGSMAIWPAVGNHERTRPHGDLKHPETSKFFSLFELPGNERWYRVDYHLHTLIILDSNSHMGQGTPQYEWLRKELRSERKRFTLVAFHHGPYTSGPHSRLLEDGTPREWPIDEIRRFISPLLEMYGVDLVLNGHDHIYERSQKDGIPYIVTGGGGAPLYKVNAVPNRFQVTAKSVHHYVRLDVSPDGIGLTAIDVKGKVIDRARFAVRKESLARRHHFIQAKIKSAFSAKPSGSKAGMLAVTIRNPLLQPLTMEFALRGEASAPIRMTIEPGRSRQVDMPSAGLAAIASRKPWDPPLHIEIRVQTTARDAALDVDFKWKKTLSLGNAVYRISTLPKIKADGKGDEWKDVPAITITQKTFIPKGRAQYHNDKDASAQIRIARTTSALLMYAIVQDDSVQDDGTRPILDVDSIHLFLSSKRGARQPAKILSFGANGRVLWNDKPIAGSRYSTTRTRNGYVMEAEIPLSLLGKPGMPIYFDLLLVDHDVSQPEPSFHRLYTPNLSSRGTTKFGELR